MASEFIKRTRRMYEEEKQPQVPQPGFPLFLHADRRDVQPDCHADGRSEPAGRAPEW